MWSFLVPFLAIAALVLGGVAGLAALPRVWAIVLAVICFSLASGLTSWRLAQEH